MSRLKFALLFALAMTLLLSAPAFATQVLYAQQNTSILTYDVDPSTLQPTLVGQPLILGGQPAYLQVVPGPNDHFVYILSGQQRTRIALSVYATDASGVPQTPAVQTLMPAPISQFAVDPNGKFAYAFEFKEDSQGNYTYALRLFSVDSSTGKLTESSKVQEKYAPSPYCSPAFDHFSSDGSKLFDDLFCSPPDSYGFTNYYRTVNPQTGQLGPDVQIFTFNDYGDSADEVRIGTRTINDLHTVVSQTSMLVYPLTSNPKAPLIHCTSAMLTACGSATAYWQDRTGMYLLFQLSGGFDVGKIDLASKQIVGTGNSFPADQTPIFSLDDSIMYGVVYAFNSTSTIQVYGFDANTGNLTTGGQASVAATLWNVVPAQRQ